MSENQETREKLAKELGLEPDAPINAFRQADVAREFSSNKGQRVLTFIEQYPFFIIGTIREVVSDFVFIRAEITNISELDGEEFRVHIDQIDVFFIENAKQKIPNLCKDFC